MSISSTIRKAGPYPCNGSVTAFPFAFAVFSGSDVRVVLTDINAVESDLVLGTNYSVTLNADQDANPGGTVTTTTQYATGYLLTLTSQVPNLQPVSITNLGGFYPALINKALDRLTIMCQQLAEQVSRSVKTDISSALTPDQLIDSIGASAAGAAASATAASGSASAAAGSATAASGSATAAANSATAAANSAASVGFTVTDLQTQGKTAFTSAGTAPNFTATTAPAYGALSACQRMRVKFHAAGTTGSNTLNRDGLGAKNLMQYDATGAKVPAVIAAGQLADVEYDGTDMLILDPLPAAGGNRADQNNTWTKAQRGAVLAVAYASSIALDFSASNNFALTLTGNATLANPPNLVAGQSGIIAITQDATGGRVLSYGSFYKFPGGASGAPVLSSAANAVDYLTYYAESASRIYLGLVKGVA